MKKKKKTWKTKMCPAFLEGACRHRYKCWFAHGEHELRQVNQNPPPEVEVANGIIHEVPPPPEVVQDVNVEPEVVEDVNVEPEVTLRRSPRLALLPRRNYK